MPYDEDSISIPPTPSRRRSSDKINWMKVAKAVLYTMPIWGTTAWQAVNIFFQVKTAIESIPGLEARVVTVEKVAADVERLKRWQCILGYDPGGKLGTATILPRDKRDACRAKPEQP